MSYGNGIVCGIALLLAGCGFNKGKPMTSGYVGDASEPFDSIDGGTASGNGYDTKKLPSLNVSDFDSVVDQAIAAANPPAGTTTGTTTACLPETSLVKGLYRDLLGRAAAPEEVAAWLIDVTDGAQRWALATGILHSEEGRRNFIRRYYVTYLRREPDASGAEHFYRYLEGGGTLGGVALGILGSDEYYTRRGGNTAPGFVGVLYRDLLGRMPSGADSQAWGSQLQQGGRDPVAAGILLSEESRRRLVQGLYLGYLRRTGEAAGVTGWSDALGQGASIDVVTLGFVASEEYVLVQQQRFRNTCR